MSFKSHIDILVALPYWLVISLFSFFTFIFLQIEPCIRFPLYIFSSRLFIVIVFILLIILSIFKPPLSTQIGPLFVGRTSHFPGVFVYHASSLYVTSIFCLGFSRKEPNRLDVFLLFLLLTIFLLAKSIGGMSSCLLLLLFISNSSFVLLFHLNVIISAIFVRLHFIPYFIFYYD